MSEILGLLKAKGIKVADIKTFEDMQIAVGFEEDDVFIGDALHEVGLISKGCVRCMVEYGACDKCVEVCEKKEFITTNPLSESTVDVADYPEECVKDCVKDWGLANDGNTDMFFSVCKRCGCAIDKYENIDLGYITGIEEDIVLCEDCCISRVEEIRREPDSPERTEVLYHFG